ncbi:MAG: aminotransferase class V-fold PLP-dependent enzyme, partial [Flavobacteriales bacterium]|nr:aminotransferase class V-fold PLP-dependent enzyme [Flavobacteriales bacterium]
SGTMTNQIAIQCHTQPGDEVICSSYSHIYNYEGGGIAKNSGSSVRLIPNPFLTAQDVLDNINPADDHYARTSLVSIEDTVNKGGGICYDIEEIKKLKKVCSDHGLGFHLDGARVFNAIVSQKHDTQEYGQLFDSISICLSKGLGCPVGSVLLGSEEFIHKAHRSRKGMGGGMRQAGFLAGAALFALDNNVERMDEDHQRAHQLAQALSGKSWVKNVPAPETNIVIFELEGMEAAPVIKALENKGILALPFGKTKIRLVTHLDVGQEKIDQACEVISSLSF